jgi:hypothetical protein
MWHVSLHRHGGHTTRVYIPASPSRRQPVSLLDRHYLIGSLPIPLTPLELDIWRPIKPDERERERNRPMDGEIRPMSDEERELRRRRQ